MKNPVKNHLKNEAKRKTVIVLFWLLVWQFLAALIQRPVFLVGPGETVLAMIRLASRPVFWRTVFSSLGRIGTGFLLAFFIGLLCGCLGYARPLFHELLSPLVTLMKTIPVASFVILALLWTSAEHLAVVISFLVVFPMIYLNTLAGLRSTDRRLLEMAQIFHVRPLPRILHIYRPALVPWLLGACQTALGMCWKSGVAAEVIGTPDYSIGEKLYMAKIYFSTDELFAWTAVIIILSFLFEKIILKLLSYAAGKCTPAPGSKSRL